MKRKLNIEEVRKLAYILKDMAISCRNHELPYFFLNGLDVAIDGHNSELWAWDVAVYPDWRNTEARIWGEKNLTRIGFREDGTPYASGLADIEEIDFDSP
jgi:hypothetical protein